MIIEFKVITKLMVVTFSFMNFSKLLAMFDNLTYNTKMRIVAF